MKKFLVVKGLKGLLCGTPGNPGRFLAQRKLSWKEGEMPKAMFARYEPVTRAYAYNRELVRLINKGQLHLVAQVVARSADEALKMAQKSEPSMLPAPPPAPKPSRSSKKKGVNEETD